MAEHEDSSGDVRVLGKLIHYRVRGSGTPLLLIHGLGASGHIWQQFRLPGSRSIAVDLPGYGWSEARPDSRSISDLAFLLDAFMATAFPGSYGVMGHSLGGLVALELALARPERVCAAALIDVPVKLPVYVRLSAAPYVGEALYRVPVKVLSSRLAIKAYLSLLFGGSRHVTGEMVEEYARLAGSPGYFAAMLSGMRGIAAWEQGERLATLKVPTAVVWGSRDRMFPPSLGRRFSELLPGSTFHTIQACGHSPPEEAPAQLADCVRPLFEPSTSAPRRVPVQSSTRRSSQ